MSRVDAILFHVFPQSFHVAGIDPFEVAIPTIRSGLAVVGTQENISIFLPKALLCFCACAKEETKTVFFFVNLRKTA